MCTQMIVRDQRFPLGIPHIEMNIILHQYETRNGFLNSNLNSKISPNLNFNLGSALKISANIETTINAEIFNYIKDNLEFDTLIWMYGSYKRPQFIYVSYNSDNRKIILKTSYNKEAKKMEYIDFEITV